jgi:hypothetical protein
MAKPMEHGGKSDGELPVTYRVDVGAALASLNHSDMTALAGMFHRWALTEESISPDQRTVMIEWSADYERIAAFCGPNWKASEVRRGVMAFLAQAELGGPLDGMRARPSDVLNGRPKG